MPLNCVAAIARDDVEDRRRRFRLRPAHQTWSSPTSCAPATFETAALEFAPAHPVLMPSWSVRESDARAPWIKPAIPPLPPVMPPASPLLLIPGNQGLNAGGAARRGDGRQDIAVDDGLDARALHVHDRRFAGNGDRLFEVADAQVAVDRGDEVATELDALALHGIEPGQRERHDVGAGTKIDDSILARVVGDDRANLFNQDRAGRFDSHARQHRAGRVFHDTGNGGLRERGRREEQDHRQSRTQSLGECSTSRFSSTLVLPRKTDRCRNAMSAG